MSYERIDKYSCDLCGNNLEDCPRNIRGHECGFEISISFFERGSGSLNEKYCSEIAYYRKCAEKHICEKCQWNLLDEMVEWWRSEKQRRAREWIKSLEDVSEAN